jgi:hypothetical protein
MSSCRVVSVREGCVDPEIMDLGVDALNKAASAVGGIDSTTLAEISLTRHDGVRKIDHVAIAAHDADASSRLCNFKHRRIRREYGQDRHDAASRAYGSGQ